MGLPPMPILQVTPSLMSELANSTDYLIFFALDTALSVSDGGRYQYKVLYADPIKEQLISMHRT
jgi:hypothetical protein